MPISARRLAWEAMSFMAHGVGSLRRTDSVAIEGIADIRRSLAALRSDANDPSRHLDGHNRLPKHILGVEFTDGNEVVQTASSSRCAWSLPSPRSGDSSNASGLTSPEAVPREVASPFPVFARRPIAGAKVARQ